MVKIGGLYGTKGSWRVIRLLGRGGQGEVYEAEDVTGLAVGDLQVSKFGELLSEFDNVSGNYRERDKTTRHIIEMVRGIARENSLPRGAMKELLPADAVANAQTALARMKAEIEALRSVEHPRLVRILDVESDRFVMEYFPDGALGKKLHFFQGDVLRATPGGPPGHRCSGGAAQGRNRPPRHKA